MQRREKMHLKIQMKRKRKMKRMAEAKGLTYTPVNKKRKRSSEARKNDPFHHENKIRVLELEHSKEMVLKKQIRMWTSLIIIRIHGNQPMHPTTRNVLSSLGLRRKFTAVLVEPNVGIIAKLRSVEPYVTYGYPNLESIKELLYKKGHAKIDEQKVPLTDDIIEQELGKFGIVCIDDMVHQIDNVGPHLNKVVRFMWPFELNKPSGGLKGSKTLYKDGGHAGNREDSINDLINKMMMAEEEAKALNCIPKKKFNLSKALFLRRIKYSRIMGI